jgi:diketogulonate reductase-like aldo/keto reductase
MLSVLRLLLQRLAATDQEDSRVSVPREEIFLTSKIWPTDLAYEAVRRRARESLERLRTGHLDLLLIHWPSREIFAQTQMLPLPWAPIEGI